MACGVLVYAAAPVVAKRVPLARSNPHPGRVHLSPLPLRSSQTRRPLDVVRPAPCEKLALLVFLYKAVRLWRAYLPVAISYVAGTSFLPVTYS